MVEIYTKESLKRRLQEIVDMGWIESKREGNHGGVGNTLEDLLGIKENNLPIPNAAEWELKTHRIGSTSLITLLHSEPSPRALGFVSKILLPKYGWPHKEAGGKYHAGEMSFRQTIHGFSASDRGFRVIVDRAEQKVVISFDKSLVAVKNAGWLQDVKRKVGTGELDPQPYWGFGDLEHLLGTKLLNCFYVEASTKREGEAEFYRYEKVTMLQNFSFEGFLAGLETAQVLVDFDARSGHNHGTKFRMRQNYFPELYETVLEVV